MEAVLVLSWCAHLIWLLEGAPPQEENRGIRVFLLIVHLMFVAALIES